MTRELLLNPEPILDIGLKDIVALICIIAIIYVSFLLGKEFGGFGK